MIEAKVKWIDWLDELPKDQGAPNMLALTASIGPAGDESADNFQVVVCNPSWVEEQVTAKGGIWPRGMLIVRLIDVDHIKDALNALSAQFSGSRTWSDFAERMNRYLLWEFEDFDDGQGEPTVPRPR